jgi:aminoglycoside 6'-N-acetyltransferase I
LRTAIEEGKKQGATVAHAAIQPDNIRSIMLYKKIGFFMDRREVALLDLNDLSKKKFG